MLRHYFQHLETESFYNISKSVKYLFVCKNISENLNCNIGMKNVAIFDKHVAIEFQLE